MIPHSKQSTKILCLIFGFLLLSSLPSLAAYQYLTVKNETKNYLVTVEKIPEYYTDTLKLANVDSPTQFKNIKPGQSPTKSYSNWISWEKGKDKEKELIATIIVSKLNDPKINEKYELIYLPSSGIKSKPPFLFDGKVNIVVSKKGSKKTSTGFLASSKDYYDYEIIVSETPQNTP